MNKNLSYVKNVLSLSTSILNVWKRKRKYM
jgi:hypothetical protein